MYEHCSSCSAPQSPAAFGAGLLPVPLFEMCVSQTRTGSSMQLGLATAHLLLVVVKVDGHEGGVQRSLRRLAVQRQLQAGVQTVLQERVLPGGTRLTTDHLHYAKTHSHRSAKMAVTNMLVPEVPVADSGARRCISPCMRLCHEAL